MRKLHYYIKTKKFYLFVILVRIVYLVHIMIGWFLHKIKELLNLFTSKRISFLFQDFMVTLHKWIYYVEIAQLFISFSKFFAEYSIIYLE